MGFPLRAVTLTALAVTGARAYQQHAYTRLALLGSFLGFWLLIALAWVFYAVFVYPFFLSPLRGLPEPKGNHWLMGQFKRILAEPTGVPQQGWVAEFPDEGIIRYKSFFNQERILIKSTKALSEVLVTKNYDFQKPASFSGSVGRLLGIGILLAEGDEHKRQRKNLMPAFAFRHVKDLYPTFWAKSREGVLAMTEAVKAGESQMPPDDYSSKTKKKDAKPNADADAERAPTSVPPSGLAGDEKATATAVLEVGQWASRITLDIIGIAGLGRDFDAIHNPKSQLATTYQHLFAPSRQSQILGLMGQFLPPWLINMLPVKRNEDVARAAEIIRGTCGDLVREKKEKLARKELTDVDILSVALESGGFSDADLVDQMMTFLAAGHETTATAMTWAVYMLSAHPEIQARLRREVRERLPSPDRPDGDVTSLDIDRMPYLNAVCSEILRYWSPVSMTVRQAVVDTSIAGHFVPRGTRVMLCPYSVNKDPAHWGPDAAEFRPERWLGRDGDERSAAAAASGGASSNFAFLTFLHGPRSCIGQAFAKAEFACLLASFVGRFEFRLYHEAEYDEKNLKIKGAITARPAHGMYVHASVVEGW